MAINISASFYKKVIEKFGELYKDPAALPALVIFVARAEKNPANFKKAVADLKNNEAILNFIADVRDNLPPKTAELFQKYKDDIYQEMELKVRREQSIGTGDLLQILNKVIEQATETNKKLDEANAALAEEKAARIAAEKQREKAKRRELFWGVSTVIGTIFGAWGIWIAKTTEPPKPLEVRQESQKPSSPEPSSIKEMKTRDIALKEKSSKPAIQQERPAVDKFGPRENPKAVGKKEEISRLFYNATRRLSLPKAATLAHVSDHICVRRPVAWSQFRRRSFSHEASF